MEDADTPSTIVQTNIAESTTHYSVVDYVTYTWLCLRCSQPTGIRDPNFDPNGTVCMQRINPLDYDKFREQYQQEFDKILTNQQIDQEIAHADVICWITGHDRHANAVESMGLDCQEEKYCDNTTYDYLPHAHKRIAKFIDKKEQPPEPDDPVFLHSADAWDYARAHGIKLLAHW